MGRYEEVKEYVNKRIEEIDNMKFYEHKVVCLFSLVDNFVQNQCSYDERNNQQNFCNFIKQFYNKNKYSYLDKIDPVTLIYDVKNGTCLFGELSEGCIYTPEMKEIDAITKGINLNNVKKSTKERHKFIKLIYKHRSRVTHEGQSAGLINIHTENEYDTPIYFDMSDYWQLIFPYKFLKDLFLDCINKYLEYQEQQGLDPFENNKDTRKSTYAFYD